jgi:hemolysin III
MKFHSQYTLTEEIFHSITHGIGAALAVAGLVVLVVLAAQEGDEWRIVYVFKWFWTNWIKN